MTEPRAEFRRLLVGLPQNASDYAAVAATARFAELLGLTLAATFIQDAALVDIATLPCVRELRPLGGGWHPIEGQQLARQLDRTLANARQLFHDAVRPTGVEASFTVAGGWGADMMGSSAAAGDIIVIIEPKNPAERVTQQFTRLVDAAFGASAAVMVVPSRIASTVGPIVVVMLAPEDPSLASALAIAAAAKERVVVLGPSTSDAQASIAEMARTAGGRIEIGPAIREPLDVPSLLAHLAHLKERLVVMSRAAIIDRGCSMIASLRGVPVLLTPARNGFQVQHRAG